MTISTKFRASQNLIHKKNINVTHLQHIMFGVNPAGMAVPCSQAWPKPMQGGKNGYGAKENNDALRGKAPRIPRPLDPRNTEELKHRINPSVWLFLYLELDGDRLTGFTNETKLRTTE